jgi:hypothetical protein
MRKEGSSTAHPQTDFRRWSDEQQLSPDWADRAKEIALFIPAGWNVVDIGCGRMDVERFLRGGCYLPVDLVRRDDRTTVVNLNRDAIPSDVLAKADCATLLGVLEYLEDPAALFRTLAEHQLYVACSYTFAEYVPLAERRLNGWFNDLTVEGFARLVEACGYRIERCQKFDRQGLFLLKPPGPRTPVAGARVQTVHASKPKVVLSGFFGRGNAGDEALLQSQYELLSPDYDIVVSVDERGARDGFWNWYPYDRCQIVHQGNLAIMYEPEVAAIHVGGGGLPYGFNAAQVVAARCAGKVAMMTGVDAGTFDSAGSAAQQQALCSYLSLFDLIYARTEPTLEVLRKFAPHTQLGADWALSLQTDDALDCRPGNDVVVVLREFPDEAINGDYLSDVRALLREFERQGEHVTLLPFCPEDERFLERVDSTWTLPREVHWWNPRRVKQIISRAKLVVSVGRLHPLIFAASVGTPCMFADLKGNAWCRSGILKCEEACREHGWPYFDNVAQLTAWLRKGVHAIHPASFAPGYADRYAEMTDHVLATLAQAAETNARRLVAAGS